MGMRNMGRWLCIVAVTMAAAAGQASDEEQLARFKEKTRQDTTAIPNYTCLETIHRSRLVPPARDFKQVDTIRVEVSSVGGKELFAWPGERSFEDRDLTAMVTSGAVSSGVFSTFAQNLFGSGTASLHRHGEEMLNGRAAIRYEFHMTQQDSHWEISSNHATEMVAAKGSFWFDPVSLDLLRLEVKGDHLPYSLRLVEAVIATDYTRVRLGETDALLPKQSEMTLKHFSGFASHDLIEFSACREYRSQSTIRFDEPATAPEAPKPQIREVTLPAGVLIPAALETAVDSKTASVGDSLRGRVVEDVAYAGGAVPRGAVVSGHLRKMSRGVGGGPYAVGIEFSEVEWPGSRAKLDAVLVDLDRKSGGIHKLATYYDGHAYKVMIETGVPGMSIFYINGSTVRIEPGLRMTLRTQ